MRRLALLPFLPFVLLVGGCGVLRHGGGNDQIAPPQTTDEELDPEVLRKFQHEVEEYIELHKELRERIPNVHPNATPEEMAAHRHKMETAIREERKGAKRGDIFKPKVERAFRALLNRELKGPDGKAMLDEIKQGNPRVEGVPNPRNPQRETKEAVTVAVNAVYNDDAPFSSVPPSLLLKLPPLPDQVRYRFVGRNLILRDGEANVILDYIPDAVPDPTLPR
jgi:hypothetical protein